MPGIGCLPRSARGHFQGIPHAPEGGLWPGPLVDLGWFGMVYHWFMTGLWLVYDWFMTGWFMTFEHFGKLQSCPILWCKTLWSSPARQYQRQDWAEEKDILSYHVQLAVFDVFNLHAVARAARVARGFQDGKVLLFKRKVAERISGHRWKELFAHLRLCMLLYTSEVLQWRRGKGRARLSGGTPKFLECSAVFGSGSLLKHPEILTAWVLWHIATVPPTRKGSNSTAGYWQWNVWNICI